MLKTILIVDDHPAVRESLKSGLFTKHIAENVYEAGNCEEGMRQTEKYMPELIVMDISMYGSSGIELTKKILKKYPEIKVVMLSMYSRVSYITEALRAGARGYILKESDIDRIIKGIVKVIEGDIYVDSHISGKVISTLLSPEINSLVVENSSYDTLTLREQEILRLLAEGLDVKDIASELCISEKTAINHRTNIMQKLNCGNMVELIKYAAHIGLIDI